ncbi:hypothetical protein [Halolamina sp. CBA1230]|uniref:hypothetical protein n=1 Tax=Halolamina sp. CBA1230 TaxID=1853690 RepID=UPI0020D163C8|nr:hypothetical protein [Halolamina sp. CBA1230]
MTDDDRAGECGLVDLPALQRIRDCWLELDPLADETAYDDVVAPTELQISRSDGLGDPESARFDIQCSELASGFPRRAVAYSPADSAWSRRLRRDAAGPGRRDPGVPRWSYFRQRRPAR